MEQSDLLRKMAETFDKLGIAYAVVGSRSKRINGNLGVNSGSFGGRLTLSKQQIKA